MKYDHTLCFWQDQIIKNTAHALNENLNVDIAIVGGGFTGLWTAYYLKQEAPYLDVALFESQHCGFGASGRNGGWLMGNLAGEHALLSGLASTEQSLARGLITGIIDEVKKACERDHIQCDLSHGGTLYTATRYPEQLETQQAFLKELQASGYSEQDYRWLNPSSMQEQINLTPCYGGIYTPHTAAIHPGKLVQGLVTTLLKEGVKIYENTSIKELSPRLLKTDKHTVKADIIVNASEAYDRLHPNKRPFIIPVQSRIVCTAPISAQTWESIGLKQRQTFSDASRLATYGQRTADNRLVFGMRGSYQFGAKPQLGFHGPKTEFDVIRSMIVELFPTLKDTEITHQWGGSLGISRSHSPSALFDSHSGYAQAGGYGGEGVGATNLMARTLVDLIFHKQSELTQAPWAHQTLPQKSLKKWEPEPFRWLAYKTIDKVFRYEEALCENRKKPNWLRRMVIRLAKFINNTLL